MSKQNQPAALSASFRLTGFLFLLAIAAYATGNGLVTKALTHPDTLNQGPLLAGALLMLLNSLVVASIGILLLPMLKQHSPLAAYGYFAARLTEAILLSVGIVFLLILLPISRQHSADPASWNNWKAAAVQVNYLAYQIAMIALGLGGAVFCRLLWRARIIPVWMAVWGLIGYVLLFAGSVAELLGYPIGVILAIPGGLFELALGIWWLVRGR